VELLRDHLETMTPEERERFLAIVEADAARLDRLVGRLYDLARADVTEPGRETTALAPVLEALIGRWRESDRSVSLEVEQAAGEARVAVAREVLETIVGNLVENAYQHAGPDADVAIAVRRLDGAGADGVFEIIVRDDGPGVSELNRGRVFDAFFTTARERGGSGLGLPIVAALARAHGGEVRLLETSRGAAFAVRLPGAAPYGRR
jgi:signal transduction histidine kinase